MPKSHPQDLIWVENIDTDTKLFITNETVKKVYPLVDEETGNRSLEYKDVIERWDHRKGFRFKFNGLPHVIAPGAKKVMTRELGEHFATKLAEHLRLKERMDQTKAGVEMLHLTPIEDLLERIIIKVQSYYLEQEEADLPSELDEFYSEFEDAPAEEVPETTPQEEAPKKKGLADLEDLPSEADLREECIAMGIELTGKESQVELAKLLKEYA